MSLFTFNYPSEFRIELITIDALTSGDVTSSQDLYLFQQLVGNTTTYASYGGDSSLTLEVTTDYLLGTTVFTLIDDDIAPGSGPQIVYQFSMASILDITGGYDLEAAIEGLAGNNPDYISYDVGNVIVGFGFREEMIGEGRFLGRGGSDKIELEYLLPQFDGDERNFAFGGGGRDILKAAVNVATVKGQNGNDTIVLEFGTARLFGGNGNDDFIFDNGFWDFNAIRPAPAEAARGVIRDFISGEDELIFASIDDTMTFGDAPVRTSLADMFGAGDLSTLANFTEDGVLHRFRENAAGDAVIIRTGTDSAGRSYDERVIIRGVGLDEIDRAKVYLQDYSEDTYEFFA
ncbi:hypothetical protein [Oceanibium sediminis]|uniref:hypothetical protein n=1 Tax=Oceanibium sediminis TaxID=2026339 RepID=UPI000DD331B0|nr:hypothetical protein [Oceanibium sediminis]